MFRKILIGHDGSEGARKAFAAALALAKRFEAALHCVSVKEKPTHYAATVGEVMEEQEEAGKYFARVMDEAKALAYEQGVQLKCTLLVGHEVETLIRFARDGQYDLMVIGFMGHSRVFGRIWGGTSQNLTKLAPCSVLVVK